MELCLETGCDMLMEIKYWGGLPTYISRNTLKSSALHVVASRISVMFCLGNAEVASKHRSERQTEGRTAVQTVYDESGSVHENLEPHTVEEPPLDSTRVASCPESVSSRSTCSISHRTGF